MCGFFFSDFSSCVYVCVQWGACSPNCSTFLRLFSQDNSNFRQIAFLHAFQGETETAFLRYCRPNDFSVLFLLSRYARTPSTMLAGVRVSTYIEQ
jgi:hypothetical protein